MIVIMNRNYNALDIDRKKIRCLFKKVRISHKVTRFDLYWYTDRCQTFIYIVATAVNWTDGIIFAIVLQLWTQEDIIKKRVDSECDSLNQKMILWKACSSV